MYVEFLILLSVMQYPDFIDSTVNDIPTISARYIIITPSNRYVVKIIIIATEGYAYLSYVSAFIARCFFSFLRLFDIEYVCSLPTQLSYGIECTVLKVCF